MGIHFRNKKYFGVLLLAMLISFITINFIGPSKTRTVLIDGDGSGLYAYLPAIFVHHTVDFSAVLEVEKQRRPADYTAHYFHDVKGTLINKFSSGQALLQLPFFFMAYFLSFIFGFPVDGYNILFQYAVAFASLFWVSIALLYFVKLAETYKISKNQAWLMAYIGFFGTNLFFYTLVAPSHSHTYSFAIITITLYYVRRSFLFKQQRDFLFAAFCFGLVVLVRPVNIVLAVAFPFLAGDMTTFTNAITSKLRYFQIVPIVLVFFLALSPQFLINYLQTGSIVFYGYQNEGFYFGNPQVFSFLFSFRKGWFVYTPLMLLLLPAVGHLFKRSKFEFFSFIGFIVLLVFVFSSWWNWFYGDSFGMRPMVDYYGLFFIVILLMLNSIKKRVWQIFGGVFIALALLLNLFQTWQYAEEIIHPDAMSRSAYAYVFLKTDSRYKKCIAATDESFYGKLNETPFFRTKNDIEKRVSGWSSNPNIIIKEGSKHVKLNPENVYSPTFEYEIPDIEKGIQNIYITFKTKFLEPEMNAAANALFVVDVKNNLNETVFYKTFKVKNLPDEISNTWRRESIGFKIPDFTSDLESIKFYIWNKDMNTFLLDDLELIFYTYQQ